MDAQLSSGQSKERWYALRVKARSERVIAAAARRKGFEGFVPVYLTERRWSDRTKPTELPLFPGYVFCRLNPAFRLSLLTIPGVLHVVGTRRAPVPIDDMEMAAIQAATQPGLRTEPWPYFQGGRPVKLSGGPLAEIEGFLIDAGDRYRLVVSMSLLSRSLAVEIDRAWIVLPGQVQNKSTSPCWTGDSGECEPIGVRET